MQAGRVKFATSIVHSVSVAPALASASRQHAARQSRLIDHVLDDVRTALPACVAQVVAHGLSLSPSPSLDDDADAHHNASGERWWGRLGALGVAPESKTWCLSLTLCDDASIAELNATYRNVAAPTDVLSFSSMSGDLSDEDEWLPIDADGAEPLDPQGESESEPESEPESDARRHDGDAADDMHTALLLADDEVWLGDVALSLDAAERQGAEAGHSARDEARVLIVHGIVHLLGFDHDAGPEEHDAMYAQEQRVLRHLSWPAQGLCAR